MHSGGWLNHSHGGGPSGLPLANHLACLDLAWLGALPSRWFLAQGSLGSWQEVATDCAPAFSDPEEPFCKCIVLEVSLTSRMRNRWSLSFIQAECSFYLEVICPQGIDYSCPARTHLSPVSPWRHPDPLISFMYHCSTLLTSMLFLNRNIISYSLTLRSSIDCYLLQYKPLRWGALNNSIWFIYFD